MKPARQFYVLRNFCMKLHSSRVLTTVVWVLSILIFGLPVCVSGAGTGSTGQATEAAQPPEPPGPPPHGHRPPPEAYEVCEGEAVGTAARFTSPRGDVIEGVCKEMEGKMVLIPDFDKDQRGPARQK
jgi:hypothetical protein